MIMRELEAKKKTTEARHIQENHSERVDGHPKGRD